MKKGIIEKLRHQEDFYYFQIKADVSVVYHIDEIFVALDEYDEGLFYPNKDIDYKTFVPERITFHDGSGTIHAIVIYNKDLIDLILFKNNKKCKRFLKLMKKRFVYIDGKLF